MANRKPIEVGEWYHCYNRGVDKRKVFLSVRDYERMLILMYLAKNVMPVRLFSIRNARLKTILIETDDISRSFKLERILLCPITFILY